MSDSFSRQLSAFDSWLRLYNPPGRKHISFRVGTYQTFLDHMLQHLTSWTASTTPLGTSIATSGDPGSSDGQTEVEPRQIHLNTDDPENWLISLLISWAEVAEILSFYQERWIQEGYLGTAIEPFSVHELARLVAYLPRPATAGTSWLSFFASEVEGLPPKVLLPIDTEVKSVPVGGSLPQTFATKEAIFVEAAWNNLVGAPPQVTQAPRLATASKEMLIAGTSTGALSGSGLLIQGTLGGTSGSRKQFFVVITKVTLESTPPSTKVSWGRALDPTSSDGKKTLENLSVFIFRQQISLFGATAPLWPDQPLDIQRQYQPILGGVLKHSDDGWIPSNRDLPAAEILCLAADADGFLYAGISGRGLFRLPKDGARWQLSSRGLQQSEILALAVAENGDIFAGTTGGGIYRSTDHGEIWDLISGRFTVPTRQFLRLKAPAPQPLPAVTVRAVVALAGFSVSPLVLGTDKGIFLSTDLGSTWKARNQGLPGVDPKTGETAVVVDTIAADAEKKVLWAGTTQGVFVSQNLGQSWKAVNLGLPKTDPMTGMSKTEISALVFHRDQRLRVDHLFAGGAAGLFISTDGGCAWRIIEGLPKNLIVTSIAVVHDPILLSTILYIGGSEGLFSSPDLGSTWSSEPMVPPSAVSHLAADPMGSTLLAGTPFDGFAEPDWPGFHLAEDHIDLSATVPAITAGSWIVLAEDEGPDQQQTVGFYQVKDVDTAYRSDFTLATTVSRIWVEPDPGLLTYDLRSTVAYVNSDQLTVLSPPRPDYEGWIQSIIQDLIHRPERRVIASWENEPTTAGALASELQDNHTAIEDLASLGPLPAIYANVVQATEGAVVLESLGEGDASLSFQQFSLAQPLGFLPSGPTPRPALEVRVHEQVWQSVPTLYGQPPDAQVYVISLDVDGMATLHFGDGIEGARIPTGRQVTATYRSGVTPNTVPPGGLSLMPSRPLGLATVTNPAASTPGASSEATAAVKIQAPQSVLVFDRVISFLDYEDYARNFPGVGKARAFELFSPMGPLLQLTLAAETEGAGGEGSGPQASGLPSQVLEAIDGCRAGHEILDVQMCRKALVEISAQIEIDPQKTRWSVFENTAKQKLLSKFGFSSRRLGDDLEAAEVIQLLQRIQGAISVRLTRLSRRPADPPSLDPGAAGAPPARLLAAPACWDSSAGESLPAELLYLPERNDTQGGVVLEEVTS